MAAQRPDNVQLGCGTLILIALIVSIFAGGPTEDLEREINQLETQIQGLDKEITSINSKLDVLLGRLDAEGDGPALSH